MGGFGGDRFIAGPVHVNVNGTEVSLQRGLVRAAIRKEFEISKLSDPVAQNAVRAFEKANTPRSEMAKHIEEAVTNASVNGTRLNLSTITLKR